MVPGSLSVRPRALAPARRAQIACAGAHARTRNRPGLPPARPRRAEPDPAHRLRASPHSSESCPFSWAARIAARIALAPPTASRPCQRGVGGIGVRALVGHSRMAPEPAPRDAVGGGSFALLLRAGVCVRLRGCACVGACVCGLMKRSAYVCVAACVQRGRWVDLYQPARGDNVGVIVRAFLFLDFASASL
jgi:hypothetical protein